MSNQHRLRPNDIEVRVQHALHADSAPTITPARTHAPQPAQPTGRQVNPIKWVLGCGGLTMVLCTGFTMLVLIVTPILFRALLPEQQASIIRRMPFMAVLQPTHAFDFLPTIAATNPNALTLLATPVASLTPVQSPDLSASDNSLAGGSPSLAVTVDTPAVTVLPAHPIPHATLPSQPTATLPPTLAPTLIPVPTSFHSDGFKWVPQGWNNCGPANLTQALQYYSWKGTQDEIAAFLKPNREDKNVSPWQMLRYVNEKTAVRALMRVAGDLNLIKRLVSQRFAVILEKGYDVAGEGWMGHYLTVIGYDDNQGVLYGLDTYLGDGSDHLGRREKYDDLDEHWQQFNRLYIVIYPKEREAELAAILGPHADLTYNAQYALSVARAEASAKPNNPFAWFNMGSSFALLGRYKDAATVFDQAWSVGGGLPFRMLWYQFTPYEAYYNVGNYANVMALAQTTLQTTAYVEETFYWRGMAEAALGKTNQAIEDFKRALIFNPNFSLATDKLVQVQNGSFTPPVVAKARP